MTNVPETRCVRNLPPTLCFNTFYKYTFGIQPLKLKKVEQDCYLWPKQV